MKLYFQNTRYASRDTRYGFEKRSTTVENSLQIAPFYAKQSQFYAFFAPKRRFHEKTNPIQTQYKANLTQNKANLSQFKANLSQFKAKTNPILKE